MSLLEKAKLVCRVTSTAYDEEINDLINAGFRDLGITDIPDSLLYEAEEMDPLITRAVMTYVKMNFGVVDKDVYNRLKASYDEQKAQLITSSQYGLMGWGDCCV